MFVVKGCKVIQGLVKKGIKEVGEWYQVEMYSYTAADSRCELCCGQGHIESKCSSAPMYGYCSGHHWTSDHKFNIVGYMAKQGSLCGHMHEKCPNCKGNHIAFSSWCAK